MLIYIYKTPSNVEKMIRIQLEINPFVDRWKRYFVGILTKIPTLDFYFSGILYNCSKPEDLPIPPVLEKLYENFKYFNDRKLENFDDLLSELKFLITNDSALNQWHLNKWHRHFTRLEMTHLKVPANELPPGVDFDEMWRHVQDINMYAHTLERHTYFHLNRRLPYIGKEQISIQHTNANNIQFAPNIHAEENIEWIDDCEFDFQTQEYRNSVWLHEEITGKDQFKTWLDHDDLTAYDCTGNRLMTPSITLDPYLIYANIINNEEFRKESIASGKKLNRYPLGNIMNIAAIDWKELRNSKVTKIILDGDILRG